MPKRSTENPLALPLMGLLMERPMHPYEMAAVLRERGKDATVRVNRGSLYDVVRTIEAEGWIRATATEREGGRPTRTVYELTPEGRAEFTARLDRQISLPHREYPRFLTAVAYIGALGPEGALAALRERRERLDAIITAERRTLDEVLAAGTVPRLYVIEAEFALHMLDGERAWITAVAEEIRDGTLAWPADPTGSEST
ncbi:PadR family transcriptional regulator [Phytomonospora sp. NPDC050363]|uniref:PadR family transcriptional regulator n=1 Tax=Phytomonospora sp. NPDC050363 TaxID=3155642 RepID=UPI0033FEC909